MKNRLIKIHDDYTEMYCHITQFEDIDKEICSKIGISPGYTIINSFPASYVSTVAGYGFHPGYFENRVIEEKYEGTFKAIGTAINSFKDIKYLPNPLNVSKIRNLTNHINGSNHRILDIIHSLEDENKSDLRKVIYILYKSPHLLIVNIRTNERIYELSSSAPLESFIPTFLWLSVQPFSLVELENYDSQMSRFKTWGLID